jgi:hypothetical protein
MKERREYPRAEGTRFSTLNLSPVLFVVRPTCPYR